jgi:hypothetical protein
MFWFQKKKKELPKLGKLPARFDKRTLKLSNYLGTSLPVAPASQSWLSKISSWPMMANDTVGDCTCAGIGHGVQLWSTYAQTVPLVPTDQQVLDLYSAITGYNPSDSSTDRGANLLDVLNYCRNIGFLGNKIYGYVQVNTKIQQQVRLAIYLFGLVYCGVQLPVGVQGKDTWDIPKKQRLVGDWACGSWGGHCVDGVKYDTTGISVISWGKVIPVSWNFFTTYFDEAYAVLSPEFINQKGLSPDNFNLEQLTEDLSNI